MQASNIPSKVPLPFANGGTKNTIPTASQIGITPGAASLTDGFPPLTMTPLASGGVPPAGADFNGILNLITAIQQWQSAGGNFKYDSAFSTSVGGYPKGAVLVNLAGDGMWLNLADNNTTNPDATDGSAANWAPVDNYGVTSIALTNANVTLTPAQFGKSIIILTGTLTGNVQLTMPKLVGTWYVVNSTTGAYTVSILTSGGTPLQIAQGGAAWVRGDGANVLNDALQVAPATQSQHAAQIGQLQAAGATYAQDTGSANTIVASLLPAITSLSSGMKVRIHVAANNTGASTLNLNGLGALPIYGFAGSALQGGELKSGVVAEFCLSDDKTTWVLQNCEFGALQIAPATQSQHAITAAQAAGVVGSVRNLKMYVSAASASATLTADEIVVETALGGVRYCLSSFSKTINLGTTGAGGMDTGSAPVSGYVALYAIYNPTAQTAALLATNATAAAAGSVYGGANMPAGYTASALVSVWPTNGSGQFVIGLQNDRSIAIAVFTVLSSSSAASTPTSLSISSAVPKNAIRITCTLLYNNTVAATSGQLAIFTDANSLGGAALSGTISAANNGVSIQVSISVVFAQTIYYTFSATGGAPTGQISVTRYDF